MPIDTAEKRRSVIGPSFHYYSPGITPNALKDLQWRRQSAHSYSGDITPVAAPGAPDVLLRAFRDTRMQRARRDTRRITVRVAR